MLLLHWKRQQMMHPAGPTSVALWLLCFYRAETFFIGMLSAPPRTLPLDCIKHSGPERSGTTHCRALHRAAFSEINERDSVFLPKTARSCQLYVCQFTWFLTDIAIKFHSRINSGQSDLCSGWTNLIYQGD